MYINISIKNVHTRCHQVFISSKTDGGMGSHLPAQSGLTYLGSIILRHRHS